MLLPFLFFPAPLLALATRALAQTKRERENMPLFVWVPPFFSVLLRGSPRQVKEP